MQETTIIQTFHNGKFFTFPRTGAIPIMTEAKAERTCWDESEDNSLKKKNQKLISSFKSCQEINIKLYTIQSAINSSTQMEGKQKIQLQ